ncbi:hypothetical protein CRM22_008115 [Opisthorchis felineus]|uniref:Uncharacterized protein n=1 Tax=Opisthorchis felineus TaxID=147828 RepID=A0A4V3SDL5_OPIFE|nr:hypothetical protein CRM22_008115 [Opisthorchis felineus]
MQEQPDHDGINNLPITSPPDSCLTPFDSAHTVAYVPNSNSFPLFRLKEQLHEDQHYYSLNERDRIQDAGFRKSTSSYSFASSPRGGGINANFLDCRLRYIRQTRRLQKYLRVTPEGNLLVNDVKHLYHDAANWQPPESKESLASKRESNPFATLISTPKLKRIYAAFWNMESRHDYSSPNSTQLLNYVNSHDNQTLQQSLVSQAQESVHAPEQLQPNSSETDPTLDSACEQETALEMAGD